MRTQEGPWLGSVSVRRRGLRVMKSEVLRKHIEVGKVPIKDGA